MNKCISIFALIGMTALVIPAQSSVVHARSAYSSVRLNNFIGKKQLVSYRAVPVKPLNFNDAWEILNKTQARTHVNMHFEKAQQLTGGRYVFTSPEDPSAVFDIDPTTGSFLLNYGFKKYTHEFSTLNLPSASQAPELARKHLAETGFLPANEREMVVGHVGGLNLGVTKYGRSTGDYKKLVTVQYNRVLEGLPVQGPGSRIIVHLGEDGALAGLIRNWPDVTAKAIAKSELKSNAVISKEIRQQLRLTAGDAKEIAIRQASLVLYDDGRGTIEPAVYVVADARYLGPRNETLVNNPVDFYVPVLKVPGAYYPYMKSRNSKSPGYDDRERSFRPMTAKPETSGVDQSDRK
ncbi:MAG: hypothetical protein HGB00_07005 [Chlorobiaceae bacterium]|nr:hypothetical protein [Chlorobiaceae bacterium]